MYREYAEKEKLTGREKEKERGKRHSFANCQIDRCNYQRIVNDNRSAIVNIAQKVIVMYFYASLFFSNFLKYICFFWTCFLFYNDTRLLQ